jgi:hypothetical protein
MARLEVFMKEIIMKKVIVFIGLFFTAWYGYGEDIYFRVIRDTPYWAGIVTPGRNNILGYIEKDTIVTHPGDTTIMSGFGVPPGEKRETRLMQIVFYDRFRGRVRVASEDLVPIDTVDLFDESFVRGLDEHWVLDVYLKALSAQDRDVIWNAHPSVWEEYRRNLPSNYPFAKELSEIPEWWEEAFELLTIEASNLCVIQTGIYMEIVPFYSDTLFIKTIVKLNNGYRVTVKNEREPNYTYNTPWFSLPQGFIDLILMHDGDYFDIFWAEDNSPIAKLIATFVKVDKSILDELYSLTQTNACDLSKIEYWPRRADGSTGPPKEMPYIASGFSASHRTTDRLRIRDNPAAASPVVTTLDSGAEVQVLETGPSAVIDGITAPWVKVATSNGYIGWCFGGYLEEITKPEPDDEFSTDTVTVEILRGEAVKDNTKTSAMPFWAWFAVIGGAVVIAGCAVVFAVRRRK